MMSLSRAACVTLAVASIVFWLAKFFTIRLWMILVFEVMLLWWPPCNGLTVPSYAIDPEMLGPDLFLLGLLDSGWKL